VRHNALAKHPGGLSLVLFKHILSDGRYRVPSRDPNVATALALPAATKATQAPPKSESVSVSRILPLFLATLCVAIKAILFLAVHMYYQVGTINIAYKSYKMRKQSFNVYLAKKSEV
jgi:hypothetical protein